MTDPRRHIKEALSADFHLDLILAAYAEHGQPEYLAAALDLSSRVYSACMSEAKRIKRVDLLHPTKPGAFRFSA